jgi:hypothetical protein
MIRPVHDWEMEAILQFFKLLYSQQIRHRSVDNICWVPLKRKKFEVKSYYQAMFNLTPIVGP